MMRFPQWIFMLFLAIVVSGCASSIRPPRDAVVVERVLVTSGYCPCGKCCGWHRNLFLQPVYNDGPMRGQRKRVGYTASGTKARHGTIAADTSIYPFGTVMEISGYGMGRVEDRGGAIKGSRIDLFFKKHRDAEAWGIQKKKVRIWIPR